MALKHSNIYQARILIDGFRLRGYHGVMNQESVSGNDFVFDIEINYDFCQAAANDDIAATLDYSEVVEIIKAVNLIPSKLLENLAYRIDMALRGRWPSIDSMRIMVSKPQPPIAADLSGVAVEIITNRG